ncbi:MAG: LptF/LptG family permease [Brevinematia bacterium]
MEILKEIFTNTSNLIKEQLKVLWKEIKEFKLYSIQIHVIKQFTIIFLASSLALTLLSTLFNLVMDLNWFLSNSGVLEKKFYYILLSYLLKGPYLYSYLAPLCVLVSIAYLLSSMSRNFELVAIVNTGMSLKKLFFPLILFSFILSIIYFVFLDQVATYTSKESRKIERVMVWEETNFIQNSELFDINEPIKGSDKTITFTRIGYISKSGIMSNVVLNKFFKEAGEMSFKNKKFEGGLIEYTIKAEKGVWDNNLKNWILYNVEIIKFDKKAEIVEKKVLNKYIPEFKIDKPDFFFPKKYDFNFLTISEMKEELEKSLVTKTTFEGGNYYQKLMQIYVRSSLSFSLAIATMLALGFVTVISRNLNFVSMISQSVIRYVLYFITFLSFVWLGENRFLPPIIAVWTPNLIFLIYGIYLNSKVKT